MPAPVIAAAITGAAALGATAIGSKVSSNASKRASDVETAYNNKALDAAREERDYARKQDDLALSRADEQKNYSRGQYSGYLGRLEPFRAAGVGAVNRLSTGLANNMGATTPTNTGGMIQIKAPGGKVFQVPAATRAHWEAKGGQVVGA